MSFLRERFKPNGGPDGGNGGRGGSVIFEATSNLQTLADLEYMHHIRGENGGHGKGAERNGPAGKDKVIYVPCGTVIYDAETGEGYADLVEPQDRFMAARGGRGQNRDSTETLETCHHGNVVSRRKVPGNDLSSRSSSAHPILNRSAVFP